MALPISVYKVSAFPLNVLIVPFKQSVSTLFGVESGSKSETNPPVNVFTVFCLII
nr:MAG TPA: hypothetical protein [Bacteriophage sp.]